jgi:hypothetical protein
VKAKAKAMATATAMATMMTAVELNAAKLRPTPIQNGITATHAIMLSPWLGVNPQIQAEITSTLGI